MTIAAVTDLDPIVAVLMASALLSLVAIRVVPFDPRLVVPFAADQITLDVPGSKGECEALLAAAVAGGRLVGLVGRRAFIIMLPRIARDFLAIAAGSFATGPSGTRVSVRVGPPLPFLLMAWLFAFAIVGLPLFARTTVGVAPPERYVPATVLTFVIAVVVQWLLSRLVSLHGEERLEQVLVRELKADPKK